MLKPSIIRTLFTSKYFLCLCKALCFSVIALAGSCSEVEDLPTEEDNEPQAYTIPCFLGGNSLKQLTAYIIVSVSNEDGVYNVRRKEATSQFIYEDIRTDKVNAIWSYDLEENKTKEVVFTYRDNVLVGADIYTVEPSAASNEAPKILFQRLHYHYTNGQLSHMKTYDEGGMKVSESHYRHQGDQLTYSALYDKDGTLIVESIFEYEETTGHLLRRRYFTTNHVPIYEINYHY